MALLVGSPLAEPGQLPDDAGSLDVGSVSEPPVVQLLRAVNVRKGCFHPETGKGAWVWDP